MISENLATLDLNNGQNRVPLRSELVALRQVRERNVRITSNLEREILDAKQAHERIEARYQDHLRQLEGIKSELDVSLSFIKLLEKQRVALRAENGKLDGILHPIRRYPEDVLRLVFETTARTSISGWFKIATNISQVCRAWRKVALETLYLWIKIKVSIKQNPDKIRDFMKQVHERIHSIPPDLLLEMDVPGMAGAAVSFLEACRVQRFQSIKTLDIQLNSSTQAQLFALPILQYSSGPLGHLSVSCRQRDNLLHPVDLSGILESFPTVNSFHMAQFSNLVTSKQVQNNLRRVTLDHSKLSYRLSPFLLFSQVEILRVHSFSDFVTDRVTLPNLVTLVVISSNFSWAQVTAPRLKRLEVSHTVKDVIDFSGRHPTIQVFETYRLPDVDFLGMISSLQNLRHLRIPSLQQALFNWPMFNLDSAPFPELASLTVNDASTVNSQDLDNLVRTRCIPHVEGSSSKDASLRRIVIIAHAPNQLEGLWQGSDLLIDHGSIRSLSDDRFMLTLSWGGLN